MADIKSSNVFDRCVLLDLRLSRLGIRRKVSSSAVEVKRAADEAATDPSSLHVSKEILASEEVTAVEKLHGEVRRYVKSVGVPSPLQRGGVDALPLELVKPVDEKLIQYLARHDALVEKVCEVYPQKVEEARARLGVLFRETDYPPVERVLAAYGMEWSYVALSVPNTLESISTQILQREEQKAAARVSAAADEIVKILSFTMKELVDSMIERMTPGEDGKPRIFRNSLVTNMTEFLETLPFRNIVGNQQLNVLAEQAKQILNGVDPSSLRASPDIRNYVRVKMEDVKSALESMVTLRPARQISFGDEAAA
jgi:hypothetical protein